jgi:dihydroorotase (multifunctional complex type)
MIDLAVVGGTLISEEIEGPFDLGVRDGRIVQVAGRGALEKASQTVSAEGLLVLPGGVDVHYHARTPAYPERGDFFTESAASAAGGVTTILEMPISNPACSTPQILRARRMLGEQQCVTDFGLYGAPGTLNESDVRGMADEGAIAFKLFLQRAPVGRENEFAGICLTEETDLKRALELVKGTGLPLVAHCENDRLLEAGLEAAGRSGRTDALIHGESRPPFVEASSVATFLSLARHVGTHAHVAHVSCVEALQIVDAYRRLGASVTAETCPHYLFFTEDDVQRVGPYAKVNPPIRKSADRDALWQGLKSGILDLVTTDHAPYLDLEKKRGLGNVLKSPAGAPGAQVLMLLMVSQALSGPQGGAVGGGLSLREAVALVTSKPARVFGLYPRKGSLQPGADADLCLYDPRGEWRLTTDRMLSKARDIDRLYADREFRGHVVATLLRGREVYREGRLLASPGTGRFLRPEGPRH